MDLSYTYFKSQFSSNVEEFARRNELKITIIGQASFKNWIGNKGLFPKNNQIVTITDQKCKFIESLRKKMNENVKIFGFYVTLASSTNFKYGILAPTIKEEVWNIKLFTKLRDFKVAEFEYPISVDPKIPDIKDIYNILRGDQCSNNYLLINKSFEDLKGIASNSKIKYKLNMIPPEKINIINNNVQLIASKSDKADEMLRFIDPIQFLLDRYFTTLYKPSIMLEHFAKSSIPKMNILRRDNLKLAKECLSNLMIDSLLQFDNRYSFQLSEDTKVKQFKNLWMNPECYINEFEKKYRLSSFEKLELGDDGDENKRIGIVLLEKINAFIDEVKLRELKLQILINMELLKILKSDKIELKLYNDFKSKELPEKRPRVTKRYSNNIVGKKKRLIPTLLGTTIPANLDFDIDLRLEPIEKNNCNLTPDGLKKLIEGLFEKLCVWDAIMGLAYKDINSSWGFLSNCLVPFYDKYHHKLISDLAVRSRGPAFILKLKSRKEKKEREEKKRKKEVEKSMKKVERKSTTIDLSKLRLERSHSSFNNNTSKVDLSRKTFDMVKSFNETQSQSQFQSSFSQSQTQLQIYYSQNQNQSQSQSQSSDPPQPILETANKIKSSNGGFMNSKKRKLHVPTRETKSNNLENSLTPTFETNSEPKISDHNVSSKDSIDVFYNNQIIEATPKKSNNSNNELSIIQETPTLFPSLLIDRPLKIVESSPISNRKSPMKATKSITQIAETPRLERVQIKPGFFEIGSSPLKIDATPLINDNVKVLSSSPLLKRTEEIPKSPSKSFKRRLNFE